LYKYFDYVFVKENGTCIMISNLVKLFSFVYFLELND